MIRTIGIQNLEYLVSDYRKEKKFTALGNEQIRTMTRGDAARILAFLK
jgi:hypothetical protein